MKPSPVAFLALSQRANVHPSRVLYVGDSYQGDVVGAKALCMHTALLSRHKAFTREGDGGQVQAQQEGGQLQEKVDIELLSLEVDEVNEKLTSYVSSYLSLKK